MQLCRYYIDRSMNFQGETLLLKPFALAITREFRSSFYFFTLWANVLGKGKKEETKIPSKSGLIEVNFSLKMNNAMMN
jgi:hypothetical protein